MYTGVTPEEMLLGVGDLRKPNNEPFGPLGYIATEFGREVIVPTAESMAAVSDTFLRKPEEHQKVEEILKDLIIEIRAASFLKGKRIIRKEYILDNDNPATAVHYNKVMERLKDAGYKVEGRVDDGVYVIPRFNLTVMW